MLKTLCDQYFLRSGKTLAYAWWLLRETHNKFSFVFLCIFLKRIAKPLTTDRPLTTNNRPPTNRQVLHRPNNCWQPTTDPSTGLQTTHQLPTTNHQLTNRSSTYPPTTDSPTHWQVLRWPTNHNSSTLLQLTTNPLTHQTYFKRVTTGPILIWFEPYLSKIRKILWVLFILTFCFLLFKYE